MKTNLLQSLSWLMFIYFPCQGEVYKWGTWTTWSSCSVSCDKGIMTRERRCFKTSSALSSTAQPNFGRRGCIGSFLDYKFCYPRDCNENDFQPILLKVTYQDGYRIRAEQCAVFNKKTYNGKKIMWKPYIKHHLNMCKLYCLASGHSFYAELGKAVRDGTPCGRDYSNVCIRGRCQKRPANCRTLDGPCTAEKRRKVIGVFNSTELTIGYNFVATIPKGATDIVIEELTNSRSYLALKDHESGNYSLNGHWRISLSKTFHSAGILIHYKRNGNTKRGGEIIKSNGPLRRSLDVMLIYQRDPSHIMYSFYVAEKEYESMKKTPPKNGQNFFYPDIDKNDDKTTKTANNPVQNKDKQSPPDPKLSPKPQSSIYFQGKPNSFKYPARQSAQPGQQSRSWYGSSWVQFGGSDDNNNKKTTGLNPKPGRPPLLNQKIFKPNQYRYQKPGQYKVGQYTDRYNQPLTQFGNGQAPGNQGNRWGNLDSQFPNDDRQFYTSDQDLGTGARLPVYIWRTAGFTPCSAICAGGVQSGVVRCIRSDTGETVLDIKCDPKLRPPERRRVCNLQPCPASWEAQEWKKCSKSCGEGEQIRDLLCKQIIDRNGEKVAAMLPVIRCPIHLRPDVMRKCLQRPCPVFPKPKWIMGSWGKCSTECNHGLQKRVVLCKDYKNETVDNSKCDLKTKPASLKSCYLGLCKAAWYSRSYWAKCSKSCDSGVQNRPVFCARVDGSAMNEIYCSRALKPKKTQTCNEPACKGVWMTSEWSQCPSDCGSGIQKRTVICMKYISGRFQEVNDQVCDLVNKPTVQKNCIIKKCQPSWFTTEWTKCSATCGQGTQTRHVSCLDSTGTKLGGCKAWERPSRRQRCHHKLCPGKERMAATQPNTSCNGDKTSPNYCKIIKIHKLCRLSLYKQRCCRTCSQ